MHIDEAGRAGREDRRGALLIDDVDASVGMNGGTPGGGAAGPVRNLVLPEFLAGFPFITGGDADIVVSVQVVAGDDGGADVHGTDPVAELLFAEVAHAAESNDVVSRVT